MVEKSGVEKFLFALRLKSSWLKSPGLKGLGLKLGVEKSGVELSFNRLKEFEKDYSNISQLAIFYLVTCFLGYKPFFLNTNDKTTAY